MCIRTPIRVLLTIVLTLAFLPMFSSPAHAADPGIDWTIRASAADNDWSSVTYGGGLFVAVSDTGAGNRVMTSPDGITWTSRTSAADNDWFWVTYGGGLFVAVSYTGAGNRVMTSGTFIPDGGTSTDPSMWTSYRQALPLPASGFCSDITAEQNTFAAYNTNVTGGWVKGWEPWVNKNLDVMGERIGGFACWRNLVNTGGNNWRTTSTP